jgi:hypothetical protein
MAHDDETATQSPKDPTAAPSSFASRRPHTSQHTNIPHSSLLVGQIEGWLADGLNESAFVTPYDFNPRDGNEARLQDGGQSRLPQSPTSAPQQSPAISQETLRPPSPPTPTYNYQPSGTPQHSNFPYSTGPTPTINPQHSPYPYQRSPTSHASNQAPVFSNVQNPNGQLSLVGVHSRMMSGFNSSHAAAMPHFLGHLPHQQPQNDRPFKCDQCPQSFNREHDLKRHKRIHLAVKPFPCNHCDKSFSRKEALKVRTTIIYESQIC